MKPRNFPARKLARQARAEGAHVSPEAIEQARGIRTKKLLASASPERRLRRRGRM